MPVQEQPTQIQYISDGDGKPISVIVPINVWEAMQQELRSERETAYCWRARRYENACSKPKSAPAARLG